MPQGCSWGWYMLSVMSCQYSKYCTWDIAIQMGRMSFIARRVRSAGICLVALALRRFTHRTEMQLSEYLAVSQSDGETDHKMSDTWAGAHLVSGVNPQATHGFHWGYVLQGRALQCKEKTRGGDPPSHPPCICNPVGLLPNRTASTWPTFRPG